MRVFLNNPGAVTCEVASRLAQAGRITVVGCLVTEDNATATEIYFPTARLIRIENLFVDGLSGAFHGVDTRFLTPEFLDSMRWAEPRALEMMDRMDIDRSQRFKQRRDLYLYLAAFWAHIVEADDIELFYSQETPHEVADFVLFAAMKTLERRNLIFSRTLILGEWFLTDDYRYPRTVYCRPTDDPRRIRQSEETDDSIVNKHLAPVRGTYTDAIAAYLNYMNAVVAEQPNKTDSSRIRMLTNRVRGEGAIVSRGLGSLARSMTAINARPGPVIPNAMARFANAWLAYASAASLEANYQQYSTPQRPDSPYVYFLLGYQPENTNCPEGGEFANQLLAVSVISHCIPDGWRVVVKEHPAQLANHGRGASGYGNLGRDAMLYEALSGIPGVELVAADADHFSMLDGASAVATLTGTAGWEAVVRGKPVLCFGEAWYQSAPNVWRIHTAADCHKSLMTVANNDILVGSDLDSALISYIRALKERTHLLVLDEVDAAVTGLEFRFTDQCDRLEELLWKYIDGALISEMEI